MNSIFKQTRRRFIKSAQIAIGSGIGVLFAHQFSAKFSVPPSSRTPIYYVYPSGKDSHPGTFEKPWKSIEKAANTLKAGETVYI